MSRQIDSSILKKYCEDISKKSVPAMDEPEVVKELLKFNQLMYDYAVSTNAYELASSIRSFGFWYENKDVPPKKSWVKQGEVHYVDLGAFNLKWEEGFIHPCVVLKKYGSSALVIPGSTKKYGSTDPLIMDINGGDGFKLDTGLMLEQIRSVSTTRILSKIGKIKPETFDDIQTKVMEKFISKKNHEYVQIKTKNTKLEGKIQEYEFEIEQLKSEIEQLKNKVEVEDMQQEEQN